MHPLVQVVDIVFTPKLEDYKHVLGYDARELILICGIDLS